jgi:hypothetical protein
VFTLLCMVAITAFLCVFLLFKVRTIEVTGDVVYEQSAILEVCDYEIGDNLALLSTKNKERALEEQLPYVEDAEIRRHFPSGLEIHITAAQKTACISSGGQWFAVSGKGKILEALSEPAEGVMEVTGLTLVNPVVGGQVQVEDPPQEESSSSQDDSSSQTESSTQEDSSAQEESRKDVSQTAFFEILQVLDQWDAAGDFVSLDMTDLYHITMNFQNRILFELGSAAGLDYKVDYGLRIIRDKLDENDTGTLDLSLASDLKEAYFQPTNSSLDSSSSTSSSSEGDSGDDTGDSDTSSDDGNSDGNDDGTVTEDDTTSDGTGEETSDDTSDDTVSQDRGGDIPNTIFMG